MQRRFSIHHLILFAALLPAFLSCSKKDMVDDSPDIRLAFSTDTVFFDTVFPTVGSITKSLVLYNTNKNKLQISNIRLMGGEGSCYRINVDGTPGVYFTDVTIPADDSIYLFVRVTLNPNDQTLPYIVNDSLEFQINGNI